MSIALIHGDARSLPFPDDSVDLIVTSPPYFGLRSYTDGGQHYDTQIGAEATPQEFIAALVACTREMARVLKPSGSIFVNLGDKYSTGNSGQSGMDKLGEQYRGGGHADVSAKQRVARTAGMPPKCLLLLPERFRIACTDELGLIARAVIVWDKPNGLPESVRDRVRRSHEDWVHLTKSPRYFESVDEIREPHGPQQRGAAGSFKRARPSHDLVPGQSVTQHRSDRSDEPAYSPLGKLPGSVWSIATQPLRVPEHLDVDHFAAFPMEWPRRLITGWSPPDGVVLDPFGGTGTTALVADVLGRKGFSVDASSDYCRIAEWRTTDPVERARAAGNDTSNVARVEPTQGDLFSEAAS